MIPVSNVTLIIFYLGGYLTAQVLSFSQPIRNGRIQLQCKEGNDVYSNQNKHHLKSPKLETFASLKLTSIRSRALPSVDLQVNSGSRKVGVYLISFPDLYYHNEKESMGEKSTLRTSKILKNWKEFCVGDGGVYFDQRPKALTSLNMLLSKKIMNYLHEQLDDCDEKCKLKVEVGVVSTCARFEILVAVEFYTSETEVEVEKDSSLSIGDLVQDAVVMSISEQIAFQRRRKRYMIQSLLPFTIFDQPSRINDNVNTSSFTPKTNQFYLKYSLVLKETILFTDGIENVSKRLCRIASGLQDRPIFRPFSARDSHIMQQIKRALDGATWYKASINPIESDSSSASTTYCKLLFESALQSGKAARSSKVVPILDELREASNGADGPPNLSRKAAESANTLAVDPTVTSCVSKFKAIEAAATITMLRERANSIVMEANLDFNGDECQTIRRLLHVPTMKLRDGQKINMAQILHEVEAEIEFLKTFTRPQATETIKL